MSSVGQELLAAGAPELVVVLQAVKTLVNTVLSGDPATAGIRASGAAKVFLGTLELQAPALAVAEFGALNTLAQNQIDGLIAKLQAPKAP